MKDAPILSESELEDRLSEPTEAVVDVMARLTGDIMFLGIAGKMGPSMAQMARRASLVAGVSRRIIGVARFTDGGESALQSHGIETIRCDLLNPDDVARLPEVPNIVYLAGRKFGSTGDEPLTWAMNCVVPTIVCQRFASSRIVSLSTGNVYGLVPVSNAASRESDLPSPVGEYAMSCLGRERLFTYFSNSQGIPMSLIRLNYACDLRYGVLVDLARSVWEGRPVDLRMGYFNTIWQGDANAQCLAALERAAAPAWVVNVTGSEVLSVRAVCEHFARMMSRRVEFVGTEEPTALLSDCSLSLRAWGPTSVTTDTLIEWVAEWTMFGGRSLGKPTHFESRDGKF